MYLFDWDKEVPIKFNKNGKPFSLGTTYVAQNAADVKRCEKYGVPFIKTTASKDELVKLIILPYLMSKFPGIRWKELLSPSRRQVTVMTPDAHVECSEAHAVPDDGVSDVGYRTRTFKGSHDALEFRQVNITDYFSNLDAVVDVAKLYELKMMPQFLDSIVGAVLMRDDDNHWEEGYNKKLGLYSGKTSWDVQGRNLLIIDVSASIPRSVSSAMLALADSLREQMKADLIITAGRSEYYPYGSELPSPQELRDKMPLGNESCMFNEILRNNVYGYAWDNVICFGDGDTPAYASEMRLSGAGTKIGKLYAFWRKASWHPEEFDDWMIPGYCKWAYELCDPELVWDNTWVKDLYEKD